MQIVITALTTTMSDGQRLAIINKVVEEMEKNYAELQAYNNQNKLLSEQRAKTVEESGQVRKNVWTIIKVAG